MTAGARADRVGSYRIIVSELTIILAPPCFLRSPVQKQPSYFILKGIGQQPDNTQSTHEKTGPSAGVNQFDRSCGQSGLGSGNARVNSNSDVRHVVIAGVAAGESLHEQQAIGQVDPDFGDSQVCRDFLELRIADDIAVQRRALDIAGLVKGRLNPEQGEQVVEVGATAGPVCGLPVAAASGDKGFKGGGDAVVIHADFQSVLKDA